jgi:hypothetical protein
MLYDLLNYFTDPTLQPIHISQLAEGTTGLKSISAKCGNNDLQMRLRIFN